MISNFTYFAMPRTFHRTGSHDSETEGQTGLVIAIALLVVAIGGITLVVAGLA